MKTTKAEKAPNRAPETAASADAASELQSVDRIRDIIFGAQMRDYEARFKQLEERMTRNVDNLRKQTDTELSALGERLDGALESEASRRKNSGKQLEQQLKAAEETLSKRAEDTTRELRAEIESLSKHVEKRLDQLAAAKTDRKALAKLLAGVADRLSADGPAKKK